MVAEQLAEEIGKHVDWEVLRRQRSVEGIDMCMDGLALDCY